MNWVIVVLMMVPIGGEENAVRIEAFNDKPLVFDSRESCQGHISKNFFALKSFAFHYFDKKYPVQSIACFGKTESI